MFWKYRNGYVSVIAIPDLKLIASLKGYFVLNLASGYE